MRTSIPTAEIYQLIRLCDEMEARVITAEQTAEADRAERWLAAAKHKVESIMRLSEEEGLKGWRCYIDTCWLSAIAKGRWKLARSLGEDADILHGLYCEIIVSQEAKIAALERLKNLNIYCHL